MLQHCNYKIIIKICRVQFKEWKFFMLEFFFLIYVYYISLHHIFYLSLLCTKKMLTFNIIYKTI